MRGSEDDDVSGQAVRIMLLHVRPEDVLEVGREHDGDGMGGHLSVRLGRERQNAARVYRESGHCIEIIQAISNSRLYVHACMSACTHTHLYINKYIEI